MNSKSEIRSSKLAALVLLPLLLASCGAMWQTDLDTAIEQARTGEYAAASPVLEGAVAGGNSDLRVVESLYYAWIRQGEYNRSKEQFDAWAASRPDAAPIRLAAGRINRLTGNYDAALSHLDAIVDTPNVGAAATLERARVLEATGKRDEATQIYNNLIRRFQNGVLSSPSDLFVVAQAMWATEYFHDANDTFRFVIQAEPRHAEALAAWGGLLAEKYNEPEAIASYQDALAIDPNMPEALLGMAKSLALTDPEKSIAALDQAMKVNPNYVDGYLTIAGQLIDSEQYGKAREAIGEALKVNPRSAEALSLTASIHFLRDERAEFDRQVQEILQLNPAYSDLFFIVAENCVSLRLYEDAVSFAREALRLNPRNWKAQSLLGVNLLRLGEEEAGKAALEAAYDGDPFNVWTVNTLTLLDSFKNFDRFESPHFRVMLHKSESAPLRPLVLDLLEKAHTDLSEKYGFVPNGPITFEMYPDHADFGVRTLGLPGIGALGVCFGKLVAMDSPSARRPDTFNWASTLWHEFAHVITLQITDHKIPRWFSEGLSVYEERKGFPGWGDDLKLPYLIAIKEGKLLPTAELNDGFIRPKFPEQIVLSYYQSSLIAEYIDEKFGFAAIRKMLLLYKDGRSTAEVFQEALGVDLAGFDSQFFEWVDNRTKNIDEKQFTELVTQGQEALASGSTDDAIAALSRAVEMYPEYSDEHNPYEPLAEAYLVKGDKPAAIATLKQYMSYNEVSYDSYAKLAELMQEAGDLDGARYALEGAMFVRPLEISGHEKLGALLLAQKDYTGAVREHEALIALNAPDKAGAYFHLAEAHFALGNRTEARRNVLKCLEIAPSFEPALELLLKVR